MERLWTLVTIAGPILFVIVLAWAALRNRHKTPIDEARAEAEADRGARKVYAEEDRASEG